MSHTDSHDCGTLDIVTIGCSLHGTKRSMDAVIGCKLKQNANEGCNSCASLAGLVLCFIACFILLVIAPLVVLFLTTSAQV